MLNLLLQDEVTMWYQPLFLHNVALIIIIIIIVIIMTAYLNDEPNVFVFSSSSIMHT
jgi:hypothetical protein